MDCCAKSSKGDAWTLDAQTINGFDKPFGSITYDTRQVVSGALLCCKGRFKAEYLDGIDDRGLAAYVASGFSATTTAPWTYCERRAQSHESAVRGILWVKNAEPTESHRHYRYQREENHYRLPHQAMLNGGCSDGKCALFSSADNCLDGHTYVESG